MPAAIPASSAGYLSIQSMLFHDLLGGQHVVMDTRGQGMKDPKLYRGRKFDLTTRSSGTLTMMSLRINQGVQRMLDVDVIPSLDYPASTRSVAGFHRSLIAQRLVQRRKPLLAVQQVLGLLPVNCRWWSHPRPRRAGKSHVSTSTSSVITAPMGKAARYAEQQVLDSVIVPYPATLEIRELDVAVPYILKKSLQ